jgi:hypothetical protein
VHSSIFSSRTKWSPLLGSLGLKLCLLILAYNAYVMIVSPSVENNFDSGTENRIIAERFIYSPMPEAVMVGSSLGRVLTRFLPQNVYDMSFSGGSPLTGAEIVLQSNRIPRFVVIETNVMERSLNDALVADLLEPPMYEIRTFLPGFRKEFRPTNILLTYIGEADRGFPQFWDWVDRIKDSVGASMQALKTRLRMMLGRRVGNADLPMLATAQAVSPVNTTEPSIAEPDDPRLAAGMKAQLDYNSHITEASRERITGAVATLATQVARLNQRGVCVLFIRLPIQPQVDATPLERYMAQSVKAAFPADRFDWIEFPDPGTYHTVDGLHLTNPSARRAAEIISDWVAREGRSDPCKSGNCCRSSNVNS